MAILHTAQPYETWNASRHAPAGVQRKKARRRLPMRNVLCWSRDTSVATQVGTSGGLILEYARKSQVLTVTVCYLVRCPVLGPKLHVQFFGHRKRRGVGSPGL